MALILLKTTFFRIEDEVTRMEPCDDIGYASFLHLLPQEEKEQIIDRNPVAETTFQEISDFSEYVFGFCSLSKLKRWYSATHRHFLGKCGYKIAVYDNMSLSLMRCSFYQDIYPKPEFFEQKPTKFLIL